MDRNESNHFDMHVDPEAKPVPLKIVSMGACRIERKIEVQHIEIQDEEQGNCIVTRHLKQFFFFNKIHLLPSICLPNIQHASSIR